MKAILTIWKGDYGVDSIDTDSLILNTYIRMAKIQYTIKYEANPLLYTMPNLVMEDDDIITNISGFEEIWKYLRSKVFDIDHFMRAEKKSMCHAYFLKIKTSFLPGLIYTLWADQTNYSDVTCKWYRNAVPFPVNLWFTYYKSKRMTEYIKGLLSEENEDSLLDEAKTCIDDLASKLGDKNYFFGENPSSLDAYVFGYLAPILNVPIPAAILQQHIKKHDNLVKFIRRISKIYFPNLKVEFKYVNNLKSDDFQDYDAPASTIVLAGLFVVTAMFIYGVSNGIIRKPFRTS